jgi:HAD superfamily hydrolase (TIGR01490 family)
VSVHQPLNSHRESAASPRAAFYDVDGTLANADVTQAYIYYLRWLPSLGERLSRLVELVVRAPSYLAAELTDRGLFNERFFAAYAGMSRDRLEELAEPFFTEVLRPRLYADAKALLEQNRECGYEPVLVTGSPDFIVRPLARAWGISHVAANRFIFQNGKATGRLQSPVLAGAEKGRWVREFAAARGIALERSLAYADSFADLPMLMEVGRPHAVNPDRRLSAAARSRHWPTLRFGRR